jgi:hypothetical protein
MRFVPVCVIMAVLFASCASSRSQRTAPESESSTTIQPTVQTSVDAPSVTDRMLTIKEVVDLNEAQAEAKVAEKQAEQAQDRKDALDDFKKGASLGISIVLGEEQNVILEAVEIDDKITVTRRAKDQPRAALEAHQLFTANPFTPTGQARIRQQITDCGKSPINCPLVGYGPFAVLQTGNDSSISSVGVGLMVGVRSDPRKASSFNLGVGIAFDSGLRELAPGFVEGKPLPTGENQVRYTERSSRRPMITISFSF